MRDIHGDIVLDKYVGHHWNQPLRIWNCSEELLAVIHISKTGGTSFIESLANSVQNHNCIVCRYTVAYKLNVSFLMLTALFI